MRDEQIHSNPVNQESGSAMVGQKEILSFWFEESGPKNWFRKSGPFDAECRARFQTTLEAAAKGETWRWRSTPEGRCAEIIVLDQLSRNIYRGTAQAFAQDPMALTLAQEAVAGEWDRRMTTDQRYFTYMPYMHSESVLIHEEAMRLFTALGNDKALHYEKLHRDVIQRFGRYPGRNAALGRATSAAEAVYLAEEGGF
ncbi:MAG: DUF924 family protein [Halieaceae bacterium]|jgi:uncharacterized protein (DUF924 family)|nr:DUF924 family protein [Halieaceae bacterium]